MNETTPDKILQTGLAFWASKTLLSAVELDLFTHLAKGPADLQTLQSRFNLHPRSSRDFLDALVALGFLKRENGKYQNAPDTNTFLDKNKPSYLGGILEMANARLFGFWNNLTEALHTGGMQNEGKNGGETPFAKIYSNPQTLRGFLHAMSGISRGANIAIAKQFPWSAHRTFVDVGAAQGDLVVQIALANPHLKGIGFDLPQVTPVFEDYVKANKLTDRVTFAPGNFFNDPFPKADVVTMGHILHDWDLPQKKMLLKKAYDALPTGGAVIVYDAIIDDDRCQNAFGLLMSLNMLIETQGGFDYTGADCKKWMQDVSFKDTRVVHLVGPDSMVIGIK